MIIKLITQIIVLIVMINNLYCQDGSDINPSKYIRIYEQKSTYRNIREERTLNRISDSKLKAVDQKVRLIWQYPYEQLTNFIDDRSCVIIDFDRISLSNDLEFVGNISVKAKFNDSYIEVPLYSTVGNELHTIGVDGVSSVRDFAASLLGLLVESNKISAEYPAYGWRPKPQFISEFTSKDSVVINIILNDIKKIVIDSSKIDILKVFLEILNKNNASPDLYSALFSYLSENKREDTVLKYSHDDIMQAAINVKNQIENQLGLTAFELIEQNVDFIKFHNDRCRDLEFLKQYIVYFTKSNEETFMAFSRAIDRDPIYVENITQNILNLDTLMLKDKFLSNKLKTTNEKININDLVRMFESMQNNIDLFDEIMGELYKINYYVLLPVIPPDIKLKADQDSTKSIDKKKRFGEFIEDQTFNADIRKYFEQKEGREFLVRYLTTTASKYIYKKLISTSINLQELKPKEGDKITIIIVWKNARGVSEGEIKDGKKNIEINFPIATFEIKELGWRLKIPDSFFLIERDTEDYSDSTRSPSKFKGGAGVSLLWSYTSDNTGNKFERIIKFIEPSLGINVSYLDFSTVKDIEIGVGFVVGLFRNKLFLSIGKNLHIDNKPLYYGVGFSFGNVASDIQQMFTRK